ncbi:MAG: pitrilysin family protein, partial [Micavibrio sp.]
MKTSLLAALFLVFLYAVPVMAQTFGAERFTLENGMEVVVIPNHRAPVVTHMVWMKAGAADERPGLSGMAHYLEHLLFKGTEKQAPGEFSRIVKTLGGNDNAFTGQDYTAYYQSIAVEHLERVMEMEADRMMNANPPPAHFASEKAVVIEERRQRTDNDPRARFAEQLSSVLFINHPYGMPIIGWMNEIEKYEWPDVKQFYETWYAPNNAILIVSGDITAKELKPLAEKYYGALKRRDIPARIRPELPPAPAQARLILRDAAIHQPVYQSLYAAPSQHMNKDDALALEVLAEIMDGGPTTRLYTNLVVNQKKAVSVFFNYSAAAYDYARLSMGAIPADGGTTDEMEALLDREIAVLLESGVTETEVRDAIQRL